MSLSLKDGTTILTLTDERGNQSVRVRVPREGFLLGPPHPKPRTGTVQWYVPHTSVHPDTVAGAPSSAIWVDVSSSNIAYFGALALWWERGENFAIHEHDISLAGRSDVLEAFEDCPSPWCTYPYDDMCCQDETGWSPCMESWRNELGCTRFRSEIIQAVPDAVTSIVRFGGKFDDGWDWHCLCDGLGDNLRAAGFSHHWHLPAVEHHHKR